MPISQANILFLLQFASCIVTALLGLMLLVSHFQNHSEHRGYEASRNMLTVAMFGLSIHYVFQMLCGIRAMGDDAGASFNMLFYVPVSFLVSYAIYNIEGYRQGKQRFVMVGIASIVVTYIAFLVGFLQVHSLCIGKIVYVMLGTYLLSLVYYIVSNLRAMSLRHRRVTDLTGAYMLPYNQYVWGIYLLLCSMAVIITVSLLSRSLLLIVSPFMLLSLFLFVMGFIGLGNHIMPISDVLTEDDEMEVTDSLGMVTLHSQQLGRLTVEQEGCLTHERMEEINAALDKWCIEGGFRDNSANIIMVSQDIKVRKEELCLFFDQYLHCTFRVWLCGVRVKEAQRMIVSNPNMRVCMVATECGFMSYEHLRVEFKTKTRMTPEEWKEKYTV